ncbi:MAG: DUF6029 family protein [Saprospiraceae bacterium]
MTAYRSLSALIFCLFSMTCIAQDQLNLSGSLESNVNFYMRDTKIGAANTPQYEHQLVGTETWLTVRAQVSGFDLGIRYDIFANSALLNPQDSYTAQGIGRWYVGKKIGKLAILAGHIYDQFGSGVIFKAYEERPLLIDNALVGLKLTYEISPTWTIKGIAGRQKNLFDLYPSVLKGVNIEGFKSFGEEGKLSIAPGIGIMHKTISDQQMDALAGTLSQYTPEDFIHEAPYNTLAGSVYNTLSAGRFTWYVEGAYKTEDVIYDQFAPRTLWTGVPSKGKFVLTPGHLIYTSLSYAGGGLGLTAQYKRTKNFNFRTDPFVSLNRGIINFLPPMSRINTYRLTARYSPATQELDEQAFQFDATYAISKKIGVLINVSKINRPDATENNDIYTEVFTQISVKQPRKWNLLAGVQYQEYNQELYEGKPGVPSVRAVIPYVDYLIKVDQKKSFRTELQYMSTKQDHGSWVYGLEEFSISPHWLFELSDMWNIQPALNADGTDKTEKLHFPTAGVVYSAGPTRYSFRYVKQVEGIVCSGGICRLEPAFSGFKFNISSNF